MKKMLLVFGSGGHSEQAQRLYTGLKNDFDIEFLIEKNDPIAEKNITGVKVHKAYQPRGKNSSIIFIPFRVVVCVFDSFIVFVKTRPDVILSTGPGIAVLISLVGKVFGKKIIYLESWSRVTTKSNAGKVMYKIANQFFVQWPEMKKVYPKAIYKGRLG